MFVLKSQGPISTGAEIEEHHIPVSYTHLPQRVIVVSPLRVIGSKQVEKKMIRSDDKFYYSFMGKKVCRIDIGVETLEFGIDP